ncbi:acyl-CoA dehydrogenase family protein [Lysinibacillus sp. 54212]|uniref:acyl-CoA dehydrogenase family protein n=1 Tax=Lysinibacillus sp. 54212 TaxID=3119829 RepID=UPI002FCA880D
MDFSLTEQQEEFRSYIRKVLSQDGVTRIARETAVGNESELTKVHEKLAELGVTGISIPEKYGGIELGEIDLIPIMEEFGRAVMPDIYAETLAFVVPILLEQGNEQQKQEYLSAIASGDSLLAVAWCEPHGDYSYDSIGTTATKTIDGYLLNGTKSLVRHTSQVTHFLLLAKDSSGDLCLFIVPKDKVTKIEEQKSFDATQPFGLLSLENVEVTSECRLAVNDIEEVLERAMLKLIVALNSTMIGSMDRLVEMSTEYAKIREQFGQPIGRFQAIKHRLADLKVTLETARALSHYATWTVQHKSNDLIETVYSAKALLVDSYIKIAAESVQIHGGIGFTEELDCHLYVKRSRVYENYFGSPYDVRERAAIAMGW